MKKRLLMTVALLCASLPSPAQTDVAPILQPHQTFVDSSGSPCAGCKLSTFIAGTTTNQPTYTDSSGISQNTNPIVLSTSGGATIWLSTSTAYKLVLKNTLGTTIWTVDNVRGNSGSTPCGPSYAIQFADSGATELDCDPLINIDPFAHAIQVGGVIGATPHFNLQNLSTIPATWTFDVTTPATALASLGGGTLPSQGANTVLMNATGGSAVPTGVALPNCPTGITYDTTAHTWGCYTAAIPLSRLAVQAADTVLMNATEGANTPTAVAMPTGCTTGVNYDTATHLWSCLGTTTIAQTDVTGSRTLGGGPYQNTGTTLLTVQGYITTTAGGADGQINCSNGSTSGLGNTPFSENPTATDAGGHSEFHLSVPAGWFYQCTATGTMTPTLGKWFETQ